MDGAVVSERALLCCLPYLNSTPAWYVLMVIFSSNSISSPTCRFFVLREELPELTGPCHAWLAPPITNPRPVPRDKTIAVTFPRLRSCNFEILHSSKPVGKVRLSQPLLSVTMITQVMFTSFLKIWLLEHTLQNTNACRMNIQVYFLTPKQHSHIFLVFRLSKRLFAKN